MYRIVKCKKGDTVWFEIEKMVSLFFGLRKYWTTAWAGDSEDYSFMYIEDAEKKLNELRFPKMVEKTIVK